MTFSDATFPARATWHWLTLFAALSPSPARRHRLAEIDLGALNPHLKRDLGLIDIGRVDR